MLEGAIVLDAALCNLPEGPEDPQGPRVVIIKYHLTASISYKIPPGTVSTVCVVQAIL